MGCWGEVNVMALFEVAILTFAVLHASLDTGWLSWINLSQTASPSEKGPRSMKKKISLNPIP